MRLSAGVQVKMRVVRNADALIEAAKGGTKMGEGKFVDGKYGSLELFDMGLEGYVGLPDVRVFQAMKQEHASTEKFTPPNKQGT